MSVLDVGPIDLAVAFKKYAWVEEVVRVAYWPGRFASNSAIASRSRGCSFAEREQLMVDDEGTILPTENIDVAALGRVIKIYGDRRRLAAPVATQIR